MGSSVTLGTVGVDLAAHHVGTETHPWPIVPGLVVAGACLALLIIPLANVVLAAVPAHAAGGAFGLFSTVQAIGGASGVAAAAKSLSEEDPSWSPRGT